MRNNPDIIVARKLAAAILKSDTVKEARLYFALRFSDPSGAGNALLDDVYRSLGDKSSDTYLLERRYLKQRVESGKGKYWFVRDGRIWLFSIEKILLNIGGDDFGKYASRLTQKDIFYSHKRFKRALYEIVHCVGNDHPIARDTLTEMTGLGRKAQRNQEGHMYVEPNFARTNLFWTDANVESMAWHKKHIFKMTCMVDGRLSDYIGFQIANTYTLLERQVERVSCSIKMKNKVLAKLNSKNGAKSHRDCQDEDPLIYGTTDKEIDKLRDGRERSKFTYYFKGGHWKAVLPTELYKETFNKEYDSIIASFKAMGLFFSTEPSPSIPPVPVLS
ncbi:MAG: hypothetical protein VW683_17605 [Betaproteobacteria bacterium]